MSFLAILNCGIGAMAVFEFSPAHNVTRATNYFLLVIGCLCFVGAIYTVIQFFKNAPVITVDQDEITFNGAVYLWSEIARISLTGKQPFTYILNYQKDGAKLTFKDGTVKYFFDDMYSNTWQVKSFIQQVIINKAAVAEIEAPETDEKELQYENFETFKGRVLLSFEGMFLWGMIVVVAFMVLKKWDRQKTFSLIVTGLFILFWFVFSSCRLNYFELSDKHLVVKNHNFFWKKKIFRISDIREISFEAPGRLPNSMRVITKDFRNKLYPAGTLRKSMWLDLKNKLEIRGIIVKIC